MSTTDAPEMTAERIRRRRRLAELTSRANELYAALTAVGQERDEIVLAEMSDPVAPATAKELAEISGLTAARVYKLRERARRS